jgi:CheY-like chemotaxis protein
MLTSVLQELMNTRTEDRTGDDAGRQNNQGRRQGDSSRQDTLLNNIAGYLKTTTNFPDELVEKLVVTVRRSIAVSLKTAAEALQNPDPETLARAMHTLKGTMLQCGLEELARRAEDIYKTVRREGSLPHAEVKELEHDLAEVQDGPMNIAAAKETSTIVADKPGTTVLLIDDDEMLRDVGSAMLAALGYSVLKAVDGVEAVDLFQQRGDIGLVMSDISMPRMDGWQTLSALRALSPTVRIIFVTGYDQRLAQKSEYPDQPDAVLYKPFTIQKLQETIDLVLA